MNNFTTQNDCVVTETDKKNLLSNMKKLLNEYGYNYNDSALNIIIDTWSHQKRELIAAFKKHPNYIEGKFMIAFNCDYERTLDKAAIRNFSKWLRPLLSSMADVLPECIANRTETGYIMPEKLHNFLWDVSEYIDERTISQELTKHLEEIIPEIKPHVGEKTSRVINRICTFLGYNKHPDYNREYAKFADGLSPMVIKRHTVLSINPLDYLTMSFGNSWASCHTIDKTNKRGMPNNYSGCYSSGTVSYMLDSSSMVFYTVDSKYDEDEYWTQPKINRQMFHWGEEKLVQGRLYPQDFDGDKDAYAPYRNIVQQIISTIFDFPNLWTLSRGTSSASEYIVSEGTHYRDYNCFDNCTLSKKSGGENCNFFIVGHAPICIECGEEHDVADNINCCHEHRVCEHCGQQIDEDETYWVGDYPYCCDCVTYCEICEEYELNENCTYINCEDRYVCEYCLDRHYSYCDECGEYFPSESVHYIDSADKCVCDGCLEWGYRRCDECGEYFPEDEVHEEDGETLCDECYQKRNEEEC
jgi:hypothetical protein